MKVGGQIPWNATSICETSQISYLMGRHESRFEIPFNGPVIMFGAMSNITCERHLETTSIWSQSLARYISWLCLVCG